MQKVSHHNFPFMESMENAYHIISYNHTIMLQKEALCDLVILNNMK